MTTELINTSWYSHPRSHNDEEDEEFESNRDKQVSVEKLEEYPTTGGEASSFSTPNQKDDSGSVSNMRLVAHETKTLQKIRIALFCFIFAVAVFATIGVYYFSRSNETQSYQADFYSHSTKVLSSIQSEMLQKMEALHSFSTILTLRGIDLNTTWPFFVVDNSAHYFDTYLGMMNAACLLVMPVISSSDIRSQWEEYAVENQGWIDKEIHTRDFFSINSGMNHTSELWNDYSQLAKFGRIPKSIHNVSGKDTTDGPYVVPWQFTPVIEMREIVNNNYLSDSEFAKEFVALQQGMATMSSIHVFHNSTISADGTTNLSLAEKFEYQMLQKFIQSREISLPYSADEPMSYLRYPVVDNFPDHVEQPRTVVILSAGLYWKTYFMNQLPDGVHGVYCVVEEINQIENGTRNAATYVIDGSNATWIGSGDLHEREYDHMKHEFNLSSFGGLSSASKEYIGAQIDSNRIYYKISIYPSAEMEDDYNTTMPLIYASVMLLIFVFTALMFACYNWYVEQRQKKIMATAMKTNAVVNSLFPSNVRDRILNNIDDSGNKRLDNNINDLNKKNTSTTNSNMSLRAQSDAIADFYPDVTLCFADLCGFTAYCSQRKPSEVFLLLETVFGSFDKIALRLGVFKVESVGDCYVAACGLPEKRKDHAVTMAKFARLCLDSLPSTLANLETTLGPGTSDLRRMRFGIHTGSVTAGVVRGQNARFQLFGDAVNLASRMESTGCPGAIQISTITADRLVSGGKGHWLRRRDDRVNVKGKGELDTYWLLPIQSCDNVSGTNNTRSIATESITSEIDLVDASPTNSHITEDDCITLRLVNWNVDILTRILRQIAYKRSLSNRLKHTSHDDQTHDDMKSSIRLLESKLRNNEMSNNTDFSMTIDEVNDVIDFTCDDDIYVSDDDRIRYEESFDDDIVKQLSHYLQVIARSYRPNFFHNFAHASHVTSSVAKLLSRIAPPPSLPAKSKQNHDEQEKNMHDHIHKIVSDPLTQFACIFAAIIHDCDHYGVPNAQLVKERLPLSQRYGNRSVAEQNSIDIAFKILMEDCYGKLRSAIYSTSYEFVRFRQLVVNGVIATDIMDKNLKELRNARWDTAFSKNIDNFNSIPPKISEIFEEKNRVHRKVTIIIEHLIQASDVAHTMQHWHVYRKWNECFFMECCQAYKNGQADSDPASNWYQGELGFFDYYIIPLTKKLKDCGVFGVSSDEYLDYAIHNRQEWENKGQQIVAEMVQRWSLMETQKIQN